MGVSSRCGSSPRSWTRAWTSSSSTRERAHALRDPFAIERRGSGRASPSRSARRSPRRSPSSPAWIAPPSVAGHRRGHQRRELRPRRPPAIADGPREMAGSPPARPASCRPPGGVNRTNIAALVSRRRDRPVPRGRDLPVSRHAARGGGGPELRKFFNPGPRPTTGGRRDDALAWKLLIGSKSFGKAFPEHLDRCDEAGCEVVPNQVGRPYPAAELKEALRGVDAIVTGTDELNAEVIASADRLKTIAKHGVGLDNIDLAAARARGIVVSAAFGAVHDSVADLTLALLLAVARGVVTAHLATRAGRGRGSSAVELRGKTLGIVGLGRIGKEVALRARGVRDADGGGRPEARPGLRGRPRHPVRRARRAPRHGRRRLVARRAGAGRPASARRGRARQP